MLESVLVGWGIDKIMITIVDNACSNDIAIDYVRRDMQEKNCTILGGEFLQMPCVSHILNHIVTDSLRDVYDLVTSIRDAVRYVWLQKKGLSNLRIVQIGKRLTGGLCA